GGPDRLRRRQERGRHGVARRQRVPGHQRYGDRERGEHRPRPGTDRGTDRQQPGASPYRPPARQFRPALPAGGPGREGFADQTLRGGHHGHPLTAWTNLGSKRPSSGGFLSTSFVETRKSAMEFAW